jgi:energy-coupling factor transporter transmembrane protein EcfT
MDFFIAIGFVAVLLIVFWRFKLLKRKYLEPIFMTIMLFGIFALCQPLSFGLYSHGFSILLTGTFGYIGAIHFK